MNARTHLIHLRQASLVFAVISAPIQALAHDWITDPLRTQPSATLGETHLPGDVDTVSCPSSPDFDHALTLNEAIDLSLCNNPQLKDAWANIKVQAAAVGQAEAAYLPTLQGSISRLHSRTLSTGVNGSSIATTGNTSYVGASWRLLDFGERRANVQGSRFDLLAAISSRDATLQTMLGNVIQAYYDAVTAEATLESEAESVTLAQSTLDSAKRRESRGEAPHSDVLQGQTALAKASLAKGRSEGDLEKALSSLVYSMGLPIGSRVRLSKLAEYDEPGEAQQLLNDLQHQLADAKDHHPAILSARDQLEAARQRAILASTTSLPTLDLALDRYQNGYPGQGLAASRNVVNSVGLVLNIPIFDGFASTYRAAGARAQVDQKAAQLSEVELQTLGDVVKAYASANAALRTLADSRVLLESAKQSVEASIRRYDRGAADISELLTTQQALADAQRERVRCLADWRAARLQLMTSVGLLGRDFVSKTP